MAIAWRKTFQTIDGVNGGNEYQLDDIPLPEAFNVSLNNTQALYDVLQSGDLNINEILSLTNNTTSNKSKWIFVPQYSYNDFSVGTDTRNVLEAVIKRICVDYPNKEGYTFFGNIQPNSVGYFILHIYNTSQLNDGLPEYSVGYYFGLRFDTLAYFGTNSYEYSYSSVSARVVNLENDVSTLEGRATTTEGDVSNLQGRASTIEGQISTINDSITALRAKQLYVHVMNINSTSGSGINLDLYFEVKWNNGITISSLSALRTRMGVSKHHCSGQYNGYPITYFRIETGRILVALNDGSTYYVNESNLNILDQDIIQISINN